MALRRHVGLLLLLVSEVDAFKFRYQFLIVQLVSIETGRSMPGDWGVSLPHRVHSVPRLRLVVHWRCRLVVPASLAIDVNCVRLLHFLLKLILLLISHLIMRLLLVLDRVALSLPTHSHDSHAHSILPAIGLSLVKRSLLPIVIWCLTHV